MEYAFPVVILVTIVVCLSVVARGEIGRARGAFQSGHVLVSKNVTDLEAYRRQKAMRAHPAGKGLA